MEITLEELKEKEIINLSNGKKLGQINDIVIDLKKNAILGFFLAGDKKLFKKSDDIFIQLGQILSIGDDVILIRLNELSKYKNPNIMQDFDSKINISLAKKSSEGKLKNKNMTRYKRIDNNKYK